MLRIHQLTFAILCSLLTSHVTLAVTYYVSPNGNDANNGTTQGQAWRTVSRVQQIASGLQAGDQVLFERGGVYPGQLTISASGSSNNPILIGAYGSGDQPVISGAVPVTGWTQYQGNIWRAAVSQNVKYVRSNGTPMTLSRHPNSGWLRSDNGSTSSLTSSMINQPSGHWNGARLVVRSNNWSYETRTISSHSNSTLNFPALQFNLGSYEWGFFLSNSLSALDSPGEWFHDSATGQLYLWAPGNMNPNSLTVEASIHDHGIVAGWQRQHIRVAGIAFHGQRIAGVRNDGASNLTIDGCSFQHCYMAISSFGSNDQYINNSISNTYASAILAQDDNTVISNNTLTDIALVPGMGESAWGYFGIYLIGSSNTVRENRLENIGYSGIFLKGSPLVERNYIRNSMAILNDGGGIHFDEVTGMVVRDNIVLDLVGSLESTGPDFHTYYKICHGIYFGYRAIINSTIQRNTVARCAGSGIHVDHSMVSSGNQVINNVLYDNGVQLSLSDYSNNVGTGAVPPYHVPNYNTVYSGNVMYSLAGTQLCMKQFHVYSSNPVDFGTFSNNRYFNPFNELSIEIQNIMSGTQKHYSLERWQAQVGEDAGSTRSPLSLNALEIINVLGANLIANGNYDYNVASWSGWPTQGQITRDNSILDNGSLRLQFSNPATYSTHYLRPDAMSQLQNGNWYELRFSLQSTMHGILRTECKTQSQLTGPNAIMENAFPFDTQRREISVIFQSNVTEPAVCRFLNHYTENQYWIDNVQLRHVAVSPTDPHERHVLFVNDGNTTVDIPLDGCWRDVNGMLVEDLISLAGFSSVVLIKEPDELCGLATSTEDLDMAAIQQDLYPNPARSGQRVHLTTAPSKTTVVELYDVSGKLVQTGSLAPGQNSLRLDEALAHGMHSMVLRNEGNTRHHRLMVD